MNALLKTLNAIRWLLKWVLRLSSVAALIFSLAMVVATFSHAKAGNVKGALVGVGIIILLTIGAAICYAGSKVLGVKGQQLGYK